MGNKPGAEGVKSPRGAPEGGAAQPQATEPESLASPRGAKPIPKSTNKNDVSLAQRQLTAMPANLACAQPSPPFPAPPSPSPSILAN